MAASLAASMAGIPTVSLGNTARTAVTEGIIGTLPSPVQHAIDETRAGVGKLKWLTAYGGFKALGAKATGEEALPVPENFDVQLCRQIEPYTNPNVLAALGGRELGSALGLTPGQIVETARLAGQGARLVGQGVAAASEFATELTETAVDLAHAAGEMAQSAATAMQQGATATGRALARAAGATAGAAATAAAVTTDALRSGAAATRVAAATAATATTSALRSGAAATTGAAAAAASATTGALVATGQGIWGAIKKTGESVKAKTSGQEKTAKDKIRGLQNNFPGSTIIEGSVALLPTTLADERSDQIGTLLFYINQSNIGTKKPKVYNTFVTSDGNKPLTDEEIEQSIKTGSVTAVTLMSFLSNLAAMPKLMQTLVRAARYEKYGFGLTIPSIQHQKTRAIELFREIPAGGGGGGELPLSDEQVEQLRSIIEEQDFLAATSQTNQDKIRLNQQELQNIAADILRIDSQIALLQRQKEEQERRTSQLVSTARTLQETQGAIDASAQTISSALQQSLYVQHAASLATLGQASSDQKSKGGAYTHKNKAQNNISRKQKGGKRNRSRKYRARKSTRKINK